MSKSLQDQLMALGLAKTKTREIPRKPQASKPATDQRAAARKSPANRPRDRKASAPTSRPDPKHGENISLEQAYRIREAEEKSAKQRARERKLEDDRKRAELNRKIRQVIDGGRLNLPDAAESRYFMYKDRIRKVHVTPGQLASLNNGELGVVYLAGGYHIMLSEQVEEVRKLSPAHVPDLLAGSDDDPFDEADFAADDLRSADPDVSDSEADLDDSEKAAPQSAGE